MLVCRHKSQEESSTRKGERETRTWIEKEKRIMERKKKTDFEKKEIEKEKRKKTDKTIQSFKKTIKTISIYFLSFNLDFVNQILSLFIHS